MKKLLLPLLALLCVDLYAQPAQNPTPILPQPRVDKRVELMSIVFRLADAREYTPEDFKLYTDCINEHFTPYKEHELIRWVRGEREKSRIGYDAVMGMAVRLDDKLRLNTKTIDSTLDARWNRDRLPEFARLLQKFVKDSHFDRFWKSNAELYAEASRRFKPIYDRLDLAWYEQFYGQKPNEDFIVVNALSNGPNNYGAATTDSHGRRTVYAIMGAWSTDSAGMVLFHPGAYFPTLVHEFNHSFVNRVVGAHFAELKPYGERIMAVVGPAMARQAYPGWQTVMCEAAVRAAVIKYLKDHNMPAGQETVSQKTRSFVWIGKLVEELERYGAERDRYPTLESYMPRIVEAYDSFAAYTETYDSLMRPHVVSISEFANGDTCVDASIRTITLNFDKPLRGQGYSFNHGPLGKEAALAINKVSYANDNRSMVIETELAPGRTYQVTALGMAFLTPDLDPILPYLVEFTTKKEQ